MPYLQIGEARQSFEQVKSGKKPLAHPAWEFCHHWLNGKAYFDLQTSGSTGKPKNIRLERAQMEWSAQSTIAALGLQEGDTFLVCLNTHFVGGKMMLVRALVGGMNLHIIEPSGNPLEGLSGEETFSFMAVVPLQMQKILAESASKLLMLNQMRAIIVGGAPVSFSLAQAIRQLDCPVFSTYGMTETISHIALKRLNGKPTQNTYRTLPEVKIGQDSRGCLTIQAPVTKNETIVTNDLVELVSESEFRWIGRADHVINSGGLKMQLEELEQKTEKVLKDMGIQAAFAIVPVSDETLGQKITLVLETNVLRKTVVAELTTELKRQLGKFKTPKSIYYLPNFPQTNSGKLDRIRLRALVEAISSES